MPLQPKISPENLKLRIADRQKEIPPPDNEDGSFNLDGFRYKPGDYDRFTSWFTFAGDSERKARELWFLPFMDKRARFLDIGALCGSWTLPALQLGASVISVEPDPNFYQIMKKNVKLNNFKKWRGYNNGVYDHSFTGDVYDMENVRFITLDNILEDDILHEGFTYVKIDVEGAELEVLRGGREFLKANLPYLFIECHGDTTVDMIRKELPDYVLVVIPWVPHILARPLDLERNDLH